MRTTLFDTFSIYLCHYALLSGLQEFFREGGNYRDLQNDPDSASRFTQQAYQQLVQAAVMKWRNRVAGQLGADNNNENVMNLLQPARE